MKQNDRPRRALRVVRRVAIVALIAAIAGGGIFFPSAGSFLVVNEPLERADAVFPLAGARIERWLEAAELHKEGWAPNLVLSQGPSESAEEDLRTRGVRFPKHIELIGDALRQLGVPGSAVIVIPNELDNTAQEAEAVRRIALERKWTRLIVVTSKYHSRRTRLAFRREFAGTPVKVIVRHTRFDGASPEEWWRHRGDIRYVISEYQKLLFYRFGLRG